MFSVAPLMDVSSYQGYHSGLELNLRFGGVGSEDNAVDNDGILLAVGLAEFKGVLSRNIEAIVAGNDALPIAVGKAESVGARGKESNEGGGEPHHADRMEDGIGVVFFRCLELQEPSQRIIEPDE